MLMTMLLVLGACAVKLALCLWWGGWASALVYALAVTGWGAAVACECQRRREHAYFRIARRLWRDEERPATIAGALAARRGAG